jgi:transposase-like protein
MGADAPRKFTEADKARIVTALAANGGNIKRTAREMGLSPTTVRRYRDKFDHGTGPSTAVVARVAGEFVEDATRIRDKAMLSLERRIDAEEIKASELITALGVLTDKVRLAEGLATSKVEHSSAFPPPDELQAILSGVVQGAIAAAERRDGEIVDAQIVEVIELPETT